MDSLDFSDVFPWLKPWDIEEMERRWKKGDHLLDIVDDQKTEKHKSQLFQCSLNALADCRRSMAVGARVVFVYRGQHSGRVDTRYGTVLDVGDDRITLDQIKPEEGIRTFLASGMALVDLVRPA
jgi:hypothetical protein